DELFDIVYRNPDADPGIPAFLKAQHLDSNNDFAVRVRALLELTSYYAYVTKQPDSAQQLLETADVSEMDDPTIRGYHSLMAQILLDKGKLQQSADHYMKAIAIAERLKDSSATASNYGNLAIVYEEMGDHEKSLIFKKRAHAYFVRKGNEPFIFIGLVTVGNTFQNLNQIDSALAYYHQAIELAEQGAGNASSAFILYGNLGDIYVNRADYQQARSYFDSARHYLEALGNPPELQQYYLMGSTPAYAPIRDVSREEAQIKTFYDTF